MAGAGLDVFDKTLQATNGWLKENRRGSRTRPEAALSRAPRRSCSFARPAGRRGGGRTRGTTADLGTRVYYDGYVPTGKPDRVRSPDEFLGAIDRHVAGLRAMGADDAARAVFKVLGRYVTKGELDEVKQSLPEHIRELFPVARLGYAR